MKHSKPLPKYWPVWLAAALALVAGVASIFRDHYLLAALEGIIAILLLYIIELATQRDLYQELTSRFREQYDDLVEAIERRNRQ